MYKKTFLILIAMGGLSTGAFMPIYSLFLQGHGMDELQMNVINMFYYIVVATFDPLTGNLADRYGRRLFYILGVFFWSASNFTYALSNSFVMFILAESVAAIGLSLGSDALEAALYNLHSKSSADNIIARADLVEKISTIVGAITLGNFAARNGLAIGWWLAGGLSVLQLCVALRLLRKVPKSRIADNGVQVLLKNIPKPRKVFCAMWQKPITRYILITSFLTKFSFMALNMYWPLMGVRAGLLEESSGLLASGMLTATLIGSLMFNKGIVFSSSIKGIGVIGLVLGIPLLFTGITSPLVFVGALLLHEVARGAYYPVFKTFLNTYTQHETRATANTIVNAARMYGGLIGLLLSGLLALKGGPNSLALTWVLSGIALTIIGGYALLIKNNDK